MLLVEFDIVPALSMEGNSYQSLEAAALERYQYLPEHSVQQTRMLEKVESNELTEPQQPSFGFSGPGQALAVQPLPARLVEA